MRQFGTCLWLRDSNLLTDFSLFFLFQSPSPSVRVLRVWGLLGTAAAATTRLFPVGPLAQEAPDGHHGKQAATECNRYQTETFRFTSNMLITRNFFFSSCLQSTTSEAIPKLRLRLRLRLRRPATTATTRTAATTRRTRRRTRGMKGATPKPEGGPSGRRRRWRRRRGSSSSRTTGSSSRSGGW